MKKTVYLHTFESANSLQDEIALIEINKGFYFFPKSKFSHKKKKKLILILNFMKNKNGITSLPKYLLKKQMIILFFFHTKMKLQVEEKIKLFGNEESKLIVQNEEKK